VQLKPGLRNCHLKNASAAERTNVISSEAINLVRRWKTGSRPKRRFFAITRMPSSTKLPEESFPSSDAPAY